jgi:hypothetical protein
MMAGYFRKTVLAPSDVLEQAAEFIPGRLGLKKSVASAHRVTYTGDEGTVKIAIHPHSLYNEVEATTDRLRTSRIDYEIQRFLNYLPFEPGDRGGPGAGDPS